MIQRRSDRTWEDLAESAVGKMDTAAPCHYQLCVGGRVENPTQNFNARLQRNKRLATNPGDHPGETGCCNSRRFRRPRRATAKEARRKATIASRLIHTAIERRPIGPAQPAGSAW